MHKNKIHIGTSGWAYKNWGPNFYRANGKDKQSLLSYYSRQFGSVEVNNSFYHLPTRQAFKTWKETTPKDFVFALKASRYITHVKKLNVGKISIRKFFTRAKVLDKKLGAILFQLPPRWHLNLKRFEKFLKILPANYHFAFEFRDPTWFTDEVYNLLKKYKIAFCIWELAGKKSPMKTTAPFVYVRLHGPTKRAYHGKYSKKTLREWSKRIQEWRKEGKEIFFYFDNTDENGAPFDAMELEKMVKDSSLRGSAPSLDEAIYGR